MCPVRSGVRLKPRASAGSHGPSVERRRCRIPSRRNSAARESRSAEAAVLADDNARASEMLAELLRLVRDLGTRRWLADALELAALVLEARGETGTAAEILGASAAVREAAGEPFGGVRSVAEEVQRGRDRLIAALGADAYAAHQARGRQRRPESAVGEALTRLGVPLPT